MSVTDLLPIADVLNGWHRRAVLHWWRRAMERRRQRRTLADLDDHLLRDIGLNREQALAEARRPFWR